MNVSQAAIQIPASSIDINGLSFQYLRNPGCSPSIVTESPTELPPDSLFFSFLSDNCIFLNFQFFS